jgi:hypothetical protein
MWWEDMLNQKADEFFYGESPLYFRASSFFIGKSNATSKKALRTSGSEKENSSLSGATGFQGCVKVKGENTCFSRLIRC